MLWVRFGSIVVRSWKRILPYSWKLDIFLFCPTSCLSERRNLIFPIYSIFSKIDYIIFFRLADERKEEGNQLYKLKNYREALAKYTEAIGELCSTLFLFGLDFHFLAPNQMNIYQSERKRITWHLCFVDLLRSILWNFIRDNF